MLQGLGLLLFLGGNLFAENKLFNSGFELGLDGWEHYSFMFNDPKEPHKRFKDVELDDQDVFAGKYSCRINKIPGRLETVILSNNILLKPNTEYIFSFYAKSNVKGTVFLPRIVSFQRVLKRDAEGKILTNSDGANTSKDERIMVSITKHILSTEWQRYFVTFKTNNFSTAYSAYLYFNSNTRGTIWLDNMQIEEGRKATAYAPASPLEAVVSTEDYLYEQPKNISGKLTAISYEKECRKPVTLTLYDTFFGKKIAEKTLNLDLQKGVRKEYPFEFNGPIPYGSFTVYTSLQPRTTEPGFAYQWDVQPESLTYSRMRYKDESYHSAAEFVVVRTPRKKTGLGFRVGTTGSYDNYKLYKGKPAISSASFGNEEKRARDIRLAGGNIFRTWDYTSASWVFVEPEPGKFDWTITDRQIEIAEKTGNDVMCVIGGMFDSKRNMLPDWVKQRDRSGNPKGTLVDQNYWIHKVHKNLRYYKPQIEDWRNYVSAVARRYKGRIQYYEILNESNLYMPVEVYMEYMKAASEEIRKADPKAKVLGLCSTSDFGANLNDFIGKALKLGADQYMDGFTIHPYAILDNSQPVSLMAQRRRIFESMKKQKVKASLWNGENYYVIPDWKPGTDYGGRTWPEAISRHLIVDMMEGLEGSVPTHLRASLGSCRGTPFFTTPNVRNKYPDARYAAHAGTCWFIAGAEPIANYDLMAGVLACTFRRKDKLYSAIWNSRSKYKTSISLNKVDCQVYDMMTNPLIEKQNLILNLRPIFIEWGRSMSVEKIDQFFKSNPILCMEKFATDRVVLGEEAGEYRLNFAVQNFSGRKWEKVTFSAESSDFAAPARQTIRRIDPMGTAELCIPLKLKNGVKSISAIKITEDCDPEFSVFVKPHLAKQITIGTSPQTFVLDKIVFGKVESNQDFSAQVTLSLKGFAFMINLSVTDDKRGKDSLQLWNTDSIELFLDRGIFRGEIHTYDQATKQIVFPRKNASGWKNGVQYKITDRENGYDAEFRIGMRLPATFGFAIGVNDSDSDRKKAHITFGGNGENFKDRSTFFVIRANPALSSRVDIRKKLKNGKVLRMNKNDVTGKEWTKQSFTVIPDQDGTLPLMMMSGVSPAEFYFADYRNIRVSGGKLLNHDLKDQARGKVRHWWFTAPARLMSENGHPFIRCSHNAPFIGKITEVKNGVPVTVSYESRIIPMAF